MPVLFNTALITIYICPHTRSSWWCLCQSLISGRPVGTSSPLVIFFNWSLRVECNLGCWPFLWKLDLFYLYPWTSHLLFRSSSATQPRFCIFGRLLPPLQHLIWSIIYRMWRKKYPDERHLTVLQFLLSHQHRAAQNAQLIIVQAA